MLGSLILCDIDGQDRTRCSEVLRLGCNRRESSFVSSDQQGASARPHHLASNGCTNPRACTGDHDDFPGQILPRFPHCVHLTESVLGLRRRLPSSEHTPPYNTRSSPPTAIRGAINVGPLLPVSPRAARDAVVRKTDELSVVRRSAQLLISGHPGILSSRCSSSRCSFRRALVALGGRTSRLGSLLANAELLVSPIKYEVWDIREDLRGPGVRGLARFNAQDPLSREGRNGAWSGRGHGLACWEVSGQAESCLLADYQFPDGERLRAVHCRLHRARRLGRAARAAFGWRLK